MVITFNFSQLQNVYTEALRSPDKSLAFDIRIGNGKFLFMMFLSDEDKDAKDNLYIYMRNTRVMKKIKVYGYHLKGYFKVYINEDVKNSFINELQLSNRADKPFSFENFLIQLNNAIPLEINLNDKVDTLRNNANVISGLGVIDEADKTVLIGYKRLTVGTPRDKTLRKLYLYTNGNSEEITDFIGFLKGNNMTVAWTAEENNIKAADINYLINNIR